MVKPLLTVTILWLFMGTMVPLYAQQASQNLYDLWQNVAENYAGIKARHNAAEAAAANELSIRSNQLPQLRAQAQSTYGTYNGAGGAFFPQAGFFNVSGESSLHGASLSSNFFGSAVVDWELFSFGKLRNENEAARYVTNKKNSEKDAYALTLKKLLSERYIKLLYSKTKLLSNGKTLQRLNEIRSITAGLAKAGLKPAADSLLATSAYTQSLAENDKLEGNSSAALIKLQELSSTKSIDNPTSLANFSRPAVYIEQRNAVIDDLHPILINLKHQANFFTSKMNVERSASLPSIHFLGGLSYKGTSINNSGYVSGKWEDGFTNNATNFLAGIGITWNITNVLTNSFKTKIFGKERESVENLHDQYQQAMQADLTATQLQISQQYKQIEKTTMAVQQAEDAYKMYVSRYKSGLIGLNEVLQIQLLLEAAENQHQEASQGYWLLVAYEAELTSDFNFLFTNL